jgi:hypothetical protein
MREVSRTSFSGLLLYFVSGSVGCANEGLTCTKSCDIKAIVIGIWFIYIMIYQKEDRNDE